MESIRSRLLAEIDRKLRENSTSVAWNYGLDAVLFIDRDVDGKKSLKTIIAELYDKNKESDNDI